VWAANGYVRLANAELHQGNLKEAEDAVHEAVQLSQQGQQPRTEAGANLTLASIMDQRGLPDQVVAPAQAALAYYQQNGFFVPAANATLLLIRAQRTKGEYSSALESVGAFQELAAKSGMTLLMTLSEEAFGSIYLDLEQYPKALVRFLNARSKANGIDAKTYQTLHCADTLWRLGRYSESDEMLKSVPATTTFQYQLTKINIDSLLSRRKDREALTLARKALADPANRDDAKETLELDQTLAESRLQIKSTALNHLKELTNESNKEPKTNWAAQLILAEISLNVGNTSQALEGAAKAADHFAATAQLSSELRSLCIAISAAKALKNTQAYTQFLNKALDILSQLQQTWEPQALRQYLSRTDLQTWMREANLSAPHDRR
jgi:tetratricopeptide (TPR) repeat protein